MADTPELLRRWLSNAHPIGHAERSDWAPAQVVLVQHGSELSVTLRQRYPETRILRSNAAPGSASLFSRQPAGALQPSRRAAGADTSIEP
jgi:hypothetical protein